MGTAVKHGAWPPSRVSRKSRDARGHMTRVMKDELYRLLEIPKPPANETTEVKAVWNLYLLALQQVCTKRSFFLLI